MYGKVLVPLDGSREAEETFNIIQAQIEPNGQVILLQVIPPARTQRVGSHIILGSQQEEADRHEAMGYLRAVARRNTADGAPQWHCEVTVAESVSDGIVRVADAEAVDLIAMYTYDRKLLARHIKRSIAREVQRKSPVEVQVVGTQELAGYTPNEDGAGSTAHLDPRVIKQVDVFKDLTDEQTTKVMYLGQTLRVNAGENMGLSGESGDRLFAILEGEAHLTTRSEVGEISVRIARPGEAFPLAALLGSGTLVTSGEALTDMEVLAIPRSELMGLCYREPELGIKIYASIGRLFSNRYAETLSHIAIAAERELHEATA